MSFSKNTFTNIFGEISSEFNVYTIEDIASDEKRSIISGPFGSNISSKYFTEHGVPVIRGNNLTEDNTKFIDEGFVFVSEEKAKELNTYADVDDLVFTAAGTIGQVGIIPENSKFDRYVISNKQLRVTLDLNKVNQHYAYYWFSSKLINKYIKQLNTGSTIPLINLTILKGLPIPLPSKDLQDKIANIIINIDKKIEINKKINKNLEELIKHIYINWFEDFEPFKGNTFHDTKLGKIPNGWNVKPLHKFIKFQEGPGIRNWQYVEEDGINFLNIRCIQNNDLILNTANMISKEEANGKYAHFMLNEWDLVISSSGTLGRYAIVRKEHLPLCLNTSIIRFKPLHSINHYAYIYSYLTSRGFYHYLLTMGSGSVQLNFGPTHLKQIDLIVPPEDVLKRYNETVFPIIEKIVKIKAEINKLTKLRDTLLPKLMSGEIDVSKINCDLELKYNYMKYLFNQIHTPMSKSVV